MYTFCLSVLFASVGRAESAEKNATGALLHEGDRSKSKVIVMLACSCRGWQWSDGGAEAKSGPPVNLEEGGCLPRGRIAKSGDLWPAQAKNSFADLRSFRPAKPGLISQDMEKAL
jgi:hypothetical protein